MYRELKKLTLKESRTQRRNAQRFKQTILKRRTSNTQ
jgi:hypothetical protein